MSKPLIGICTDHVRHFPAPDRDRSYLKLYPQYCQAVIAAGGTPLVIPIVPHVDDIRPLLKLVQGVVTIGADDYPSTWYDKPVLPTDKPVTAERAAFDREFVRVLYDETELPVLAVCGGMQLAAIFSGGALIQDLPHQPVVHRSGLEGESRHSIEVQSGTVLANALGVTMLEVNSLHHQAVERVGPRLRITAHAPDGVAEALEFTDHPFRVGVQWHPERMHGDTHMQKLFAAFVAAAQSTIRA